MEPMEIKEVVDVLIKGANGKIPNFKEEEAIAFEQKAIEVIRQANNDLIIENISPIIIKITTINVNISSFFTSFYLPLPDNKNHLFH